MLSYCPALQSVVSTHTRSEDAVEPVYSKVKPTEHVETGMQVSPVPYSPSTHSHLAVWSDPLMSTAVQIARWSQGGTHSKGTHHRSEEEVGAAASYSVSAHSVKIAHTAKVVAAVDCKVVCTCLEQVRSGKGRTNGLRTLQGEEGQASRDRIWRSSFVAQETLGWSPWETVGGLVEWCFFFSG